MNMPQSAPDPSGEYARGLRDAARVAKNWKARSVTHLDECLDQASHDEHWSQIIGPQIADAILAALRSPDPSGEYARGLRDAANVALAIELKTGDPKCVHGHDRCESGADEDCPYCERKTPVADAILALPQSAAVETSHRRVIT